MAPCRACPGRSGWRWRGARSSPGNGPRCARPRWRVRRWWRRGRGACAAASTPTAWPRCSAAATPDRIPARRSSTRSSPRARAAASCCSTRTASCARACDADPELARLLDGLRMVPGYGFDETTMGTTAAAVALAEGAAVALSGPEHFVAALTCLAEAAAPIPSAGVGRRRGREPPLGGVDARASARADAGRAGRRARRGRAGPPGAPAAGTPARPRRRPGLGAGHRRAHRAHQRRRTPARRRRPPRAVRRPAGRAWRSTSAGTATSTCPRRAAPTSSWNRCCWRASPSAPARRGARRAAPHAGWRRRRGGRARTSRPPPAATTPRTCAATGAPSTPRPASGPTASCSRRSCAPGRKWRRASGRAVTTC